MRHFWIKIQKKFWGGGTAPTPPRWGGGHPSQNPTPSPPRSPTLDLPLLGQDLSQTKKFSFGRGLGLAGLALCCETRSCYARRRNDLEGHRNFSSSLQFIVSLFCAWNIITMEINCGVHLLKS